MAITMANRREIIEIDDGSSDDQYQSTRQHIRSRHNEAGPPSLRQHAVRSEPLQSTQAAGTLPQDFVRLEFPGNERFRTPQSPSARRTTPFGQDTTEPINNNPIDPLADLRFGDDVIDPAYLDMEGFPSPPPLTFDEENDPPQGFDSCLRKILELFPDISHLYVQELYDAQMLVSVQGQTLQTTIENLTNLLLEKGKYPKERDRLKELKRKRPDSDEEEVAYLKSIERGEATFQYSHIS